MSIYGLVTVNLQQIAGWGKDCNFAIGLGAFYHENSTVAHHKTNDNVLSMFKLYHEDRSLAAHMPTFTGA